MRTAWILIATVLVLEACTKEVGSTEINWIDVPAGEFTFGDERGMENEKPALELKMHAFQLSASEVSNAMFDAFVRATHYKTDAEKAGSSLVYMNGWVDIKGANWRHPQGSNTSITDKMDHPVVHVSHADAMAFCAWARVRLPTEIEWEYACKKGQTHSPKINIDGTADGFTQTAPVRALDPDKLGFFHLAGNVWEWCADSYQYEIHDKWQHQGFSSRSFYTGKSFDPNAVGTDTLRVIKGGSFLCQAGYCMGYLPYARQNAPQHGSYFHLGFRVARDLP